MLTSQQIIGMLEEHFHIKLPQSGTLAGSSVANLLVSKDPDTINDVDIFQIERTPNMNDKWYRYHSIITAPDLMKSGSCFGVDGTIVLINREKGYSLTSSQKEGCLNTIHVNTNAMFQLTPLQLISGFDLNCCQAAIDLTTKELIITKRFREFMGHRYIELTNPATPIQSFLRALQKRDTLDYRLDIESLRMLSVLLTSVSAKYTKTNFEHTIQRCSANRANTIFREKYRDILQKYVDNGQLSEEYAPISVFKMSYFSYFDPNSMENKQIHINNNTDQDLLQSPYGSYHSVYEVDPHACNIAINDHDVQYWTSLPFYARFYQMSNERYDIDAMLTNMLKNKAYHCERLYYGNIDYISLLSLTKFWYDSKSKTRSEQYFLKLPETEKPLSYSSIKVLTVIDYLDVDHKTALCYHQTIDAFVNKHSGIKKCLQLLSLSEEYRIIMLLKKMMDRYGTAYLGLCESILTYSLPYKTLCKLIEGLYIMVDQIGISDNAIIGTVYLIDCLNDVYVVKQLMTKQMLLDEGRLMRHCVGGYSLQVLRGDSCIFHIHDLNTEEMATLEVTSNFCISQLKGVSNKAVSNNMKKFAYSIIDTLKVSSVDTSHVINLDTIINRFLHNTKGE